MTLGHNRTSCQESETLSREVLRVRGSMLAPDDEGVLHCMRSLAQVIEMQGKYDESEKIWREVLLARSLSLGPEHLEVLTYVRSLCCSLFNQRKYVECETKIRQTLESLTKILGPERMYLLRTTPIHKFYFQITIYRIYEFLALNALLFGIIG